MLIVLLEIESINSTQKYDSQHGEPKRFFKRTIKMHK